MEQVTIFNHKKQIYEGNILREVMFGMEDGMVSTLGSVTGIAIGSQSRESVLLAGFVIIAVESISMGIGSYIANRTKQSADRRKVLEEKIEIRDYHTEEKDELLKMYVRDGWPKTFAEKMVTEASGIPRLMLKEMSYRELQVYPGRPFNAFRSGSTMFISYVLGGLIPLVSYVLFPISTASVLSVANTLTGLFLLGVFITKYTGERWYRSGIRVLIVGGIAMSVGLVVGELFSTTM